MADNELLNVFLELLLKVVGEVFLCIYVCMSLCVGALTKTALPLSSKQNLHFKLDTQQHSDYVEVTPTT